MFPAHISEPFYNIFKEEITLSEFVEWLYENYSEIEQFMKPNDYLELMWFKFERSYAMYDLMLLTKKYINPGEIATRELLSFLNKAKENSPELPLALEMIYYDYEKGYYFLQEIALGYGLNVVVPHPIAQTWHDLTEREREEMVNSFFPELPKEVACVISLLEDKKIVLTGEKDDDGRYIYHDFRDKKDRIQRRFYPVRKQTIWIVFVMTTVILLALDLWLKGWAVEHLRGQENRVLIGGVLGLTYFENSGAFFGFLSGFSEARWLLAGLKVVILCGLAWYYGRLPLEKRYWLMRIPLLLVFVGGLGNLVDRVTLGIVRDMLEFLFMNFAIFNLADVYVTVGVFTLMLVGLFMIKDFPFP